MENFADPVKGSDSSKGQGGNDALINSIAKDICNPQPGRLMSFQDAPDNASTRMGLVTVHGVQNVPRGIWNAAVHDVTNPLETAETLGTAAGMAFVLKTVLPEGGMAAKVAGAAIGAYFTYKAAEPIYDAYKKAGHAQSLQQLDVASRQFGDAGGSFIVNSAVAAIGYKVGSNLTDRWLTSASMDGFADAKANFYEKLSDTGTSLTERVGLSTPKKIADSSPISSNRVRLEGSERQTPQGTSKGEVDPTAEMEVSVMLKSKGSDLRMERTLARIAQGRQAPLTDTQFAERFGASQQSLDAVSKFAQDYGIKVADANLTSGRVVLNGTVSEFSQAFETKLTEYEDSGISFRGREGSLSIPKELESHIGSVLGTDNRPQARANIVTKFFEPLDEEPGKPGAPTEAPPPPSPTPTPPGDPPIDPSKRQPKGYMPNQVADAYNFPKNTSGKGQGVAIVELGGGLDVADNAKYYTEHNLPQPKINIIEVGGAKNKPGFNSNADGEVALDSQVVGVVAPEATQNLIFAPNSDKGFIDAITRGTFPEAGEVPNSSISISWGAPEEIWTQQAVEGMGQAFKKAALKGISIFAASGDDGALDRARSGKWQVDFPASNPQVTGTGGTRLNLNADGTRGEEISWNNHRQDDASGGGVSQLFPPQEFQKDSNVPLNANTQKPGRGVPDIAGNADPLTGYRIRVGGREGVIGGTSAVAPLYSALMMRINESMGKPIGDLNQWFYKNTSIFNDITVGDNNAYKAGPGWDAVTGLGSLDGTKMLNALQKNPNIAPTFGQFRFTGPSQFFGPTQSISDLQNAR